MAIAAGMMVVDMVIDPALMSRPRTEPNPPATAIRTNQIFTEPIRRENALRERSRKAFLRYGGLILRSGDCR